MKEIGDETNLIEETQEDVVLDNILAELGGKANIKVNVYRTGKEYHGKQVFVTSMLPEEFSLEMLRDELGGGEFRIHVRDGSGLIANKGISVEEKKQPEDNFEKFAALMQQNTKPDNGLEKMAEIMGQGFSRLGELIIQANQTTQAPPMGPNEIIGMMSAMKQLTDGGPKEDQTSILMKGIELAQNLNPSDKESNSMDVILEALKSFGEPIAKMAMNQMPPQIAGTQHQQPQQQTQPNQGKNMGAIQNVLIKGKINDLLKQAKKGSDTGLYADLIIDQLPAEQINAFLGAPDWFQVLSNIVPEVANYQPWFSEVREFVIESLTGGETDDTVIPESQNSTEVVILGSVAGSSETVNIDATGGDIAGNT